MCDRLPNMMFCLAFFPKRVRDLRESRFGGPRKRQSEARAKLDPV